MLETPPSDVTAASSLHATAAEKQPLLTREPASPHSAHDAARAHALGSTLMGCSAVTQACSAVAVNLAEQTFHVRPAAAILVRSATSLALSSLYLFANHLPWPFHIAGRRDRFWFLSRGILGTLTTFFMFTALSLAPVGLVITLFSTSPTIVSCLASMFLGEPFTIVHLLSLGVNFVGVLLVCHPATNAHLTPNMLTGLLFALCAAFSSASAYVLVRALGTSVHFMHSGMIVSTTSLLTAIPIVTVGGFFDGEASPAGVALTFLAGSIAFVGQGCINRSLQLTRAGPAAVMRSITIPMSLLLGVVFLGEHVGFWNLLGVALILSSVMSAAVSDALSDRA